MGRIFGGFSLELVEAILEDQQARLLGHCQSAALTSIDKEAKNLTRIRGRTMESGLIGPCDKQMGDDEAPLNPEAPNAESPARP